MTPRDLLDAWLASSVLRPSTQARYRLQVEDWLSWCERRGVHPYRVRVGQVAAWSEERLLDHLGGRALDGPAVLAHLAATKPDVAGTHDGYITAVTQYYTAAHERGLVVGVPYLTDLRCGVDRAPDRPRRLSPPEREAFLVCIGMWGPGQARQYLRDRLIAHLLLDGLRPGEVVRMDMRHRYPQPDGAVEVRVPDAFENVGPKYSLSLLTAGALSAYLPRRPRPARGVHAVILGQGGRPVVSRYVNKLIRQMVSLQPALAERCPPVTADLVAHTRAERGVDG